jgi:transposase
VLEHDFELVLVNARQVKQVPGRKSDVTDAAWLCQLAEAGLLGASFVPPKPIRDLRQLTRYRRAQIAERTREAQRLHTPLEQERDQARPRRDRHPRQTAAARCSTRLVAGTTDPELLAELAPGKPRKKIPALTEALQGPRRAARAADRRDPRHLDFPDEQIDLLSRALEEQTRPSRPAVEPLRAIPGVRQRTAELLIAEIDTDTRAFPTAGHLASWAGQRPGNDQSAGRRRNGRTRSRSTHLNAALKHAAMAATRTNDSYPQSLYRRNRPQPGHGRALGAAKHSIICACSHTLTTGEL